jgi:hypothetical protein
VVAAPAIFAWRLAVATMIATGGSYWDLLVQQISWREILLRDQVQNMLAQDFRGIQWQLR